MSPSPSTSPSTSSELTLIHPLTHARWQRGWSQQRLAELLRQHGRANKVNLGTGKNRVWRWENYGTTPDDQTQLLLADILGVARERAAERSWPEWLPAWEDVRFHYQWSCEGAVQALCDVTRDAAPDRRGFVGLTGAPLAALVQGWQHVPPQRLRGTRHGRHVDTDVVRRVADRTHHLHRMDDSLGGCAIRMAVAEELRLLTGLLHGGRYTAEIAGDLFRVAAELAQLAGWASFDAGLHGVAQRYYITALHAAHTAQDPSLGGYVLADMSDQLAYLGHPHDAATLVRAGLGATTGLDSPGVSALQRFQLASALAATGESRESARALASATREAARFLSQRHTAPTWLYWLDPSHLDAREGRCLDTLGQGEQAIGCLRAAIGSERSAFVRDRAVHRGWLAEAHLKRGEHGLARTVASRARELADQVDSPRTAVQVRTLQRNLARTDESHHGSPGR